MTQLQDWFYRYNGWSFAKHELWARCKKSTGISILARLFFYPGEHDVDKIKRLKDLTPKNALQGKLSMKFLKKR
jgi:hypothetical protein